jgi:iron-sulfur cluster repair protein YtfE (RIC family)
VRSLLELLEVHAGLREQLAVHRDFVVGLEFARALAELEKFERELRVHMDAEEAFILPLYRERAGKVLGGDPDFFTLEHKSILRSLETAKESLRKLAVDPGAGRRQAHEFLDQEGMLLHLLEHHDLREKNTLYPRLDEVLTEAEREDLLRRCGRAT